MNDPSPTPRRRLLRFSLRGLMLVVLVIAVALGWTIHEAKKQGVAVAALEKAGWTVVHDKRSRPPTILEQLRKLLGEDEPMNVAIVFGTNSQGNDAGLANVRSFSQLVHLDLATSGVTDTGLVNLKGLNHLWYLSLGNTKVTDIGLVHLQGLKELEDLDLTGTSVTDAGLIHCQGLTQLERLYLGGTAVTEAGVKKLQRALPKCDIRLK